MAFGCLYPRSPPAFPRQSDRSQCGRFISLQRGGGKLWGWSRGRDGGNRCFTPQKLRILEAMKSTAQLAERAGRNVKNVYLDVKGRIGLIELYSVKRR